MTDGAQWLNKDEVLDLIRTNGGIMRARDLRERGAGRPGANPGLLDHLVKTGELISPVWGVYAVKERLDDQNVSLAFIFARQPKLFVCLESAAAFHGLIDRDSTALYLAAGRDIRVPTAAKRPREIEVVGEDGRRETVAEMTYDLPSIKIVRWSGMTVPTVGIEEFDHHGVPVRVTSPERTVCDLLRCLNKPFRGAKAPDGSHPAEYPVIEANALQAFEALVDRNGGHQEIEEMAQALGCWDKVELYVKLLVRRTGFR